MCYKKIEELRKKAPHLRQLHLKERLSKAKASGQEEAVKEIQRIMSREAKLKRWGRMKHTTKPKKGGTVFSVRVKASANSTEQEYTTESGIFDCVSLHLSDRFPLAFTGPSCSGQLFDDIGYIGDTEALQQILEGTYIFPPGTDPPVTRLLLKEVTITYMSMPKDEIVNYVAVEDFQYYWQRANKRLSPSYSCFLFTYWPLKGKSRLLSTLHSPYCTLPNYQRVHLCWACPWRVDVDVVSRAKHKKEEDSAQR